jgi:hypothetical protein
MAQGGYSGKAPGAEQEKKRAENNNIAEQRITAEVENKCNQRMAAMQEQHDLEITALRNKLAQVESERIMLLRILDGYAKAVDALRQSIPEPAITDLK